MNRTMRNFPGLAAFLCLLFLTLPVGAQNHSVVPLADPFILLDGDTYYAYGTHDDNGIEVWTSKDLVDWTRQDDLALSKANTTEQHWFWAPEVYRKNGRYYMYFSANEHLFVATADKPTGPFKQVGSYMMESIIGDEKCIDSSVFFDEDGKAYCFFVRFTDGNCIWMCQLKDDLLTPVEGTLHECLHVTEPWESLMARVAEGPFVWKQNGTYFLTYSANDYQSQDYAIGFATSDNIMGQWKKSPQNPIVHRANGLYGTGHHSFFTDKQGRMRIVYHSHYSASQVHPRLMHIGSMTLKDNKLSME